ncbi:MAG: electron transport complex subunit E [Desulfobacteraceae bacterium]|nr:electron transport complex subunit E [Desulfobacteraceae bacterium]MBU4055991.1 electron transport complex subunit E [Pseudomonadota bacterium]
MAKSITQEFVKGLWAEVPPFRLVLGLCPTLAVTKSVESGLGMGLATTFVLVCSNLLVSMLRSVIPAKVRIACFIIIIATFVTVVQFLAQAYAYPLYKMLGMFIPLIVVNCIVLGRSEAFAFKNPILPSLADGLGMGIGYTIALGVLAGVRELLGAGSLTIWGNLKFVEVFGASFQPFSFMIEAPGAFMGLGLMLCLMNMMGKK